MLQAGPPWPIRALRGVLRRLPRGRYHALSTIAPNRGRWQARLAADLGGAAFDCDLSDQISHEVCFTGLYEPPMTRVFQQHARQGGTVVDAGANWGYFTLVAAASVGATGRVIALEPDPRQFAALQRNLALNDYGQVLPMPAAASSERGRLTLAGYAEGEANRGVTRVVSDAADAKAQRFEVDCVTIDELTSGAAGVDLVKIDVEGAEDLVLAGMRDGLAGRRYGALLIELHPRLLASRGASAEACIQLLLDHRYRGWTLDASAGAYRRAIDPALDVATLLRPLDDWRAAQWPHLLWLC